MELIRHHLTWRIQPLLTWLNKEIGATLVMIGHLILVRYVRHFLNHFSMSKQLNLISLTT